MEDYSCLDSKSSRFVNPWVHNFHKLGLELKCPLCLNLLNRPVLLPCNHVFCQSCISDSADCSVCKAKFMDRDVRHLSFMENMASIFRCLDSTFSPNLIQPSQLDGGRISLQCFDERNDKEFLENGIGGNSFSRQSISKRVGVDQNVNAENLDVKLMTQTAPGSPPSCGDTKGSDSSSYFQSGEHSSNSQAKRESGVSTMGKLWNDGSCLDDDVSFRKPKRHRQLDRGLAQSDSSKADHIHGIVPVISNLDSKRQKIEPPVRMQTPKTSDNPSRDTTVCAFCHSSKISEETGVMLHYLNGRSVVGREAALPSAVHVHKLCFEWAPQVFYADDKVQNLESEVARGAKLKCSKCGQKGAALGCYVRSCRKSYHVPCAMKIAKCRWNHVNYLMLCPTHSSVKFPDENLKAKKKISKDHAMPALVRCQLSNRLAQPDQEKKWVLCGSALSAEEKILMVKFGKMNDALVSKFWNPKVTHVIAATDDKGACTRTLKVLMAILNGRWIVKVDWIKACIEAKSHVDEEPFEVSLDNYGCRDAPKNGRLRETNNEPKLFHGLNFFFAGDFVQSYLEDLQDLVVAAGGILIKNREEMLAQKDGKPAVVVYNIDPPEGSKLGEEVSILWKRLSDAEDVALQTGSKVVGHTWILESIAAHKLQSFVC